MDERLSTTLWRTPVLRSRSGRTRMIRPWQRSGRWSPEEAAAELHRRRAGLIGQLRRRSEARGVPAAAQEEIVDDAITAVVMAPRGVANEHHLMGAFWLAVDHRCRRHREGRHFTRLGSRQRVEFDLAAQKAPDGANPFDALELRDRFARAADLMADLDQRERQVVSVMASNGVGPGSAARLLGLPLGEVRSAARSANLKLDRVAAISAAGRMCQFRASAIAADAAGAASEHEARLARAHVSACVPCGRVYRQLRREMRGREFQRAAVAAFLPLPAVSVGHIGAAGKLAIWIEQRINFMPRGGGERAAEALGGAGIAKAAVAGTAIVAAGGALTGHLVHSIEGAQSHAHHRARVVGQVSRPAALARGANLNSSLAARSPSSSAQRPNAGATARHGLPTPPSKSLGYLALGRAAAKPSSGSGAGGSTSEASARIASATGTSTRSESTATTETAAPPPSETAASSTQGGGGTNLGYLGP
jgi:DNA-directed RNA polymerase specialized sigma24 family protein